MQSPWAANKTQQIPRTPAENTALTIGRGKHPTGSAQRDYVHREIPRTAPRDRTREIHCHSAATPAGRTQISHSAATPGKARETGKIRASKGPGS